MCKMCTHTLYWLIGVKDSVAFMSSVHDCRSHAMLCTWFSGVDFWSWVLSAKSNVDWVIGYNVWKWSSVQNKQYRSQPWALWNTKHERRRKQNCWYQHTDFCPEEMSNTLKCSRADAPKDSFLMGKKNLVTDSIKCNWKWKIQNSRTEILSLSTA